MRNFRTLARTVLLTMVVSVPATQPAKATGIPVIDVANLAQTILQVSNDVTKLANQATQISNQVNQLRNQTEMLRNIGPSQFSALTNALSVQNTELNAILSAASSVQYALANVQSQINSTFPQGNDWSTFDMSTLGPRVQQWDTAVTQANTSAIRAQASLNRVSTRNAQIQGLLTEAQGANGQVRQLQINAQINGQIAQALNDNAMVTATAARAQMLEQQRAVAERELGREQHRRAMQGFVDRGAPVTVRTALPAIVQP